MDITGAIPTPLPMAYDLGWNRACNNGCNDYGNGSHADHDSVMRSLSDIRMEGKQSEGVLLQTAASNAAVAASANSDTLFRLHDNIRTVGDQVIASSTLTQAQLAAQYAATQLQIANTSAATQASIASTAAAAALQGEKNTAAILAALSATELRQLQDELNETRLHKHRYETEINFGSQFSAVQSQINKLDQIQRSTNQAINFGSGSTGRQDSTSNQVR